MLQRFTTWYSALSTGAKGLVCLFILFAVGIGVVLAIILSPLFAGISVVVLIVSIGAVLFRLLNRNSVRRWGIIGIVSLVLLIVFSSVAVAVYGSSNATTSSKETSAPQTTTVKEKSETQSTTQKKAAPEKSAPTSTSPKKAATETTAQNKRSRDTINNKHTAPKMLYANPRTPEETVLSSIEKERKSPLKQDIRAIVDTDQNGCRYIQLNYQTRGSTSIEGEMEEFYKAIYTDSQYSNTVCQVTITAYGVLTDRFGQQSLEEVYQTTLTRDQANQINWANSSNVNFPSIWTTNYVNPSVQADIEKSNLQHNLDCLQSNGLFDWIKDALTC